MLIGILFSRAPRLLHFFAITGRLPPGGWLVNITYTRTQYTQTLYVAALLSIIAKIFIDTIRQTWNDNIIVYKCTKFVYRDWITRYLLLFNYTYCLHWNVHLFCREWLSEKCCGNWPIYAESVFITHSVYSNFQ